MENKDIRWQQRFANYNKALSQLKKFIDKGSLNELEEQGLIQAFEYTYELAWNVLKDFLSYQGNQAEIYGSRDAITEAFKVGLIENGNTWMEMFKDRNRTSHTYNEETANAISKAIINTYFHLFIDLQQKMNRILNQG